MNSIAAARQFMGPILSRIVPRGLLLALIGLAFLLSTDSAVADTPETSGAQINLSGVWQLNEDLSDKLESPQRQSKNDLRRNTGGMPGQRPGGETDGMEGGGSGMGGRGRGGRGGKDGMSGRMRMTSGEQGQPQQIQAMMEEMRQGRQRLLITHIEPEMEIIDAHDKALRVLTDNSPVVRSTEYGDVTDQAWWQNAQLVIKTRMADTQTITRTFELAPLGEQLIVTIRIDMPQTNGIREFRLVYDSV